MAALKVLQEDISCTAINTRHLIITECHLQLKCVNFILSVDLMQGTFENHLTSDEIVLLLPSDVRLV